MLYEAVESVQPYARIMCNWRPGRKGRSGRETVWRPAVWKDPIHMRIHSRGRTRKKWPANSVKKEDCDTLRVSLPDAGELAPTGLQSYVYYAQYTPPTRLISTVESRRRRVLGFSELRTNRRRCRISPIYVDVAMPLSRVDLVSNTTATILNLFLFILASI